MAGVYKNLQVWDRVTISMVIMLFGLILEFIIHLLVYDLFVLRIQIGIDLHSNINITRVCLSVTLHIVHLRQYYACSMLYKIRCKTMHPL